MPPKAPKLSLEEVNELGEAAERAFLRKKLAYERDIAAATADAAAADGVRQALAAQRAAENLRLSLESAASEATASRLEDNLRALTADRRKQLRTASANTSTLEGLAIDLRAAERLESAAAEFASATLHAAAAEGHLDQIPAELLTRAATGARNYQGLTVAALAKQSGHFDQIPRHARPLPPGLIGWLLGLFLPGGK